MKQPERSDNTENLSGTTESERIAQTIHDAVDRFAAQAADAEQRVRAAAGDAETRMKASGRAARGRATEAGHAVESYIDEHPWTSLGVAFGAGIIISSMLRR
jgi:ElaB/YqjD/DUF883 family membrane-anchored ribosome-binding protein